MSLTMRGSASARARSFSATGSGAAADAGVGVGEGSFTFFSLTPKGLSTFSVRAVIDPLVAALSGLDAVLVTELLDAEGRLMSALNGLGEDGRLVTAANGLGAVLATELSESGSAGVSVGAAAGAGADAGGASIGAPFCITPVSGLGRLVTAFSGLDVEGRLVVTALSGLGEDDRLVTALSGLDAVLVTALSGLEAVDATVSIPRVLTDGASADASAEPEPVGAGAAKGSFTFFSLTPKGLSTFSVRAVIDPLVAALSGLDAVLVTELLDAEGRLMSALNGLGEDGRLVTAANGLGAVLATELSESGSAGVSVGAAAGAGADAGGASIGAPFCITPVSGLGRLVTAFSGLDVEGRLVVTALSGLGEDDRLVTALSGLDAVIVIELSRLGEDGRLVAAVCKLSSRGCGSASTFGKLAAVAKLGGCRGKLSTARGARPDNLPDSPSIDADSPPDSSPTALSTSIATSRGELGKGSARKDPSSLSESSST